MTNSDQVFLQDNQTIVALCTPQGAGAIGLIRLSGSKVFELVDAMSKLASGQKISQQTSHTIHYGWVIDHTGQQIDQVLFLVMHAPKTFTGEHVVEITCHNNQFLIEAIIDRAIECGARMAGKGEFTQRAVEQGKIDLLQAEAINDLIHAQTASSLKYSLQQVAGSLSSMIGEIEVSVLEILAYCEGSFEFLDEEMEFAPQMLEKIEALLQKVEKIVQAYPKQQYIKQGLCIALIGSVNVGKSSLFNALIQQKRAIVTPIAGTTRDTIEAGVYRDGETITFIDTAGIRATEDSIEQEGIDRSFAQAAQADIILLVLDQSQKLLDQTSQAYAQIMQQYQDKIIIVGNKVDIAAVGHHSFDCAVQVSAKNSENIDALYALIFQKIKELKGNDGLSYMLNKRQHDLLVHFAKDMHHIARMLENRTKVDYELVSYHLGQALSLLSEMTGRSVSQAALDKVFQTFCVGK